MLRNLIRSFILKLSSKYPIQTEKLIHLLGAKYPERYFSNINIDMLSKQQKRVFMCYLYIQDVDLRHVYHANQAHFYQMIKCLIDMGYCIDLCYCMDTKSVSKFNRIKYDMILGFGPVYKQICKMCPDAIKILFVTENNPETVYVRYAERMTYFKERHPDVLVDKTVSRYNLFYDQEMFKISDSIISMSSKYNSSSLLNFSHDVYRINCNYIYSENFIFSKDILRDKIHSTKDRFLWFGSLGFIHKGGDILLDAFREMPSYSLDLYGILNGEVALFDLLKSDNTFNRGFIKVNSDDFIEEVVNQHCFMIFPSCSEGMSTSVATCMAHGIIPIVTKETGFDPFDCIIELPGWKVEDIISTVNKVISMSDEQILNMREQCYLYARNNFSLEHFDEKFREIMKNTLVHEANHK